MHTTTDSVTLNRSELRALLAHASRDENRPHMAGLGVDLREGRVFATDGQRGIIAQSRGIPAGASAAPFVVPRALLEEGMRLCGKGRLLTVRRWGLTATSTAEGRALGPGGDHVSVEVTEESDGHNVATLHAPLPDALPPALADVVPPPDRHASRIAWSMVQPAFLRDLATIAEAAAASGIRVWAAAGEHDPIRVDAAGPTAQWTAVLMPMAKRDDDEQAPVLVPSSQVVQYGTIYTPSPEAASETDAPSALPASKRGKRSRKVA